MPLPEEMFSPEQRQNLVNSQVESAINGKRREANAARRFVLELVEQNKEDGEGYWPVTDEQLAQVEAAFEKRPKRRTRRR